jgi:hypothetical protein
MTTYIIMTWFDYYGCYLISCLRYISIVFYRTIAVVQTNVLFGRNLRIASQFSLSGIKDCSEALPKLSKRRQTHISHDTPPQTYASLLLRKHIVTQT